MSEVAHVVARAVVDDPHTLGVVALAAATADGKPDAVFAVDGARGVKGVASIARFDARKVPRLVYHPQGAAPVLVAQLVDRAARLVVAYDGMPLDPLAVRDLQLLASAGAAGLAPSTAGIARLVGLGFQRVQQVAPVVAGMSLAAVPAFPPTANHLAVALHGPLVVTVDTVATAANAAKVVQAYHVLRTYLAHSGHLAIAVPVTPETNRAALHTVQREMWGLRLIDAWAQRLLNPGERAAFTRGAAVFVTTEPASGDVRSALAAMAEGVAVVAPADPGAADLLGDGALLLPPVCGAALVAEAVAELLGNESRRAELATRAMLVAARYAPERVAPAWHAALAA